MLVTSSTNKLFSSFGEDPTNQIPFRMCNIVSRIRVVHPQIIFKVLSRREVEVPVVSILLRLIKAEVGPLRDMYQHASSFTENIENMHLSLASAFLRDDGEHLAASAPASTVEDFGYFIITSPSYSGFIPTTISKPSRSLVIVLRACHALCKDMNLKPIWLGERWSFHWSFMDRYLLSREFADLIFLLWHHYRYVKEVEVKSLCLGILIAIADKVRRNHDNTVIRPPGKAAPNFNHTDVGGNELECRNSDKDMSVSKEKVASPPQRRRSSTRSQSFSSGLSASIVIVPISKILPLLAITLSERTKEISGDHKSREGIFRNKVDECDEAEEYAINSESVLCTLEGLKLFLCNEDEETILRQHGHYFAATPLCQSVVYLLDQYPTANPIQNIGLFLLLCLCKTDPSNLDILGENCRCLISPVVSFPTEQAIHHNFCALVLALADRSARHRSSLLFHAIYKWLFIPIKFGWHDVMPVACRAVAAIADTPDRASMVGMAKLCEVLLNALAKHKSIARVQIEGLRAVLALAKSPNCIQKMKASGGKRILMESRRYLMKLATERSNLPAGYDHAELVALLSETNDFPDLFDRAKCVIS